ncbi:MAG TPA: HAMP domain-containing sensor histidine kinase, partial [Candidatus Methylacidiphilales bacterium]
PDTAEIYNQKKVALQTGTLSDAMAGPESRASNSPSPPMDALADSSVTLYNSTSKMTQKAMKIARKVSPQQNFNADAATLSNTVPEESDFRRLIGTDTSGELARFLDDKLRLMVWSRPSSTGDLIFGAQLNHARLLEKLKAVLQAPEFKERDSSSMSRSPGASYCLALLDEAGHPVALSIAGFTADWKHPLVATEIGETLPHWEAALYLTDPQQMSKSAHTLQLTIGLFVLILVVAIVAGGSLIAADIRRQVRLAQQKTAFVSNVSHELKTPLTSIRMFADLLAEGRVTEPERQMTYLKIISAESARLTRLINNVLDFARQERGAPQGERRPCDLVETTRDVVETCLPHLEAGGQVLSCEIEAETLPVSGDRDALAQTVLNLISNAEKYGGGEILVRVRQQGTGAGALGCVDVLDRGPGIPSRQVESIFLPFHRLHDSLSSGTPGSGLGLTLARRMARVHGGDITYTPRAGGGSCFTLTVPLAS